MKKAFTKGQPVTYISDWDRKGTVFFRHAIVYSCGAKQMVLTDAETGEEMGRHFRPAVGDVTGTFPRMTDDEARVVCLAAAEAILASERASFARCLSQGHGENYDAAIRKNIAALHEPRAVRYADARAALTAAVQAKIANRR